ncbi:MAG: glycosyltransferase family 2 protein, partial [Candidatus Cryptobacteroides sp.]
MVSVIVPVYNTAGTLAGCIDSILAQSYTDFELIIIDDGSTDGSGLIADTYPSKDSRVKVWHQDNAGISAARNEGLSHASGDWVAFCDSDDTVRPDWLAAMMRHSHKAPMIICGYYMYRMDRPDQEPQKTALDYEEA